MRSGRFHQRILGAMAVIAAASLAVSGTLPAQAQTVMPAVEHSHAGSAVSGPPACNLSNAACRARAIRWEHSSSDSGAVFPCLYRSDSWCMGMHFDAAGMALEALEAVGDASLVATGIKLTLEKGPSWIAKIVELYGQIKNIKPFEKFLGDCIGAWTRGGPLTPGACDSRHGIYWEFQNEGKYDYRLWDTYTKQNMVINSSHLGEDEWIRSDPVHGGEWYTWADFTSV